MISNTLRNRLNLVIFGLATASLPLVTNLGRNLEYEYATIVAWLTLTTWPPLSIWISKRCETAAPHRRIQREQSLGNWALNVLILLAALAFPGGLFYQLKICPCSQSDFWLWMGLQVLPAATIAATMGLILRRFLPKSNSQHILRAKIRISLFWMALIVICLCQLAALLWFYPQKRTVHFLTGMIHGPIYDRKIWLHQDHMILRGAHLILASAMGLAASRWRHGMSLLKFQVVSVLCLIWLVLTIGASKSPITGHGATLLQNQFEPKVETQEFTLFHMMDHDDAQLLKSEITFHIQDLKKNFGPLEYPKIEIYAYSDSKTKKLWFGGGATDVADVQAGAIHITVWGAPKKNDPNAPGERRIIYRPHPSLRHELIHALTSKVAFGGLGFHPNMALTEGLAVAFAPDGDSYDVMSLDQSALELIESGKIKDPIKIFSPWAFWVESGPRAYTVAGSFIQWIYRQFGARSLMEVYSGGSWDGATGLSAGELSEKWIKYLGDHLKTNHDKSKSRQNKVHANTRFRSRGVSGDRCPHSIANMLIHHPSEATLNEIHEISGNPAYLVRAFKVSANNLVNEILRSRSPREAANQLATKILELQKKHGHWPPETEEDVELTILAIDLADFSGKYEYVRGRGPGKAPHQPNHDTVPRTIESLARFNALQPLPAPLARQIIARRAANAEPDLLDRTSWRLYLSGWAGIPQTATVVESKWIYTYLRLRNLLSPRSGARPFSTKEALDLLKITPDRSLVGRNDPFSQEWYRNLAIWFEQPDGVLPPFQSAQFAGQAWLAAAKTANSTTAKAMFSLNAQRVVMINMP